ncbi:hypothetical protein Tco_1272638 [Tanacetum coccineum]
MWVRPCAQHADNDTYSALAVDIAVQSCFLELQLTSFSPKNCKPPEVLLQLSLHPACKGNEHSKDFKTSNRSE